MSTKRFKDPVHGYIELPEDIVANIVDTRLFQRLRHVRQMSATYLVYPGANHTRFEHSLGVYHLATQVFENLRTWHRFRKGSSESELDDIQRTLQCAALLHDVGHPPMSHLGEHLLDERALRDRLDRLGLASAFEDAGVTTGRPDGPLLDAGAHELLSCVIVLEAYADRLRELGVDPLEVCGYILGYSLTYERTGSWHFGVAAEVLHSPIDVDRLDYIIRDSEMTGAEVLNVDRDRMIEAYTAVPEEGLALRDKALSTVGNYLEGRVGLYMWVTQHHKSVFANVLLRAMVDELAAVSETAPITTDGVLDRAHDDYYAMERIRAAAREHPDTVLADLHDRFRSRRFPESLWKHRIGYDELVTATDDMAAFTEWLVADTDGLERRLASALDLPVHEVWVAQSYVPEYEPAELMDIPIAHKGATRSVAETGLYAGREFEDAIPFVYVPEGHEDDAVAFLNDAYEARVVDPV